MASLPLSSLPSSRAPLHHIADWLREARPLVASALAAATLGWPLTPPCCMHVRMLHSHVMRQLVGRSWVCETIMPPPQRCPSQPRKC